MQLTSPSLGLPRFSGISPATMQAPSVRFGGSDGDTFTVREEDANRQLIEALGDSSQYYDFHLRERDGILGFLAEAVGRLGGKDSTEGQVASGLFDDRAKEYRAERRADALEAIRNGASPEAVITYEKSYQRFVDEPVLRYAVYNHATDLVQAFFETSPGAVKETIEKHPEILDDLLRPGINNNHGKTKQGDVLDGLFLYYLGPEKLMEADYSSPVLSGSFLLGAVYNVRPDFVQGLAEADYKLSANDVDDLMKALDNDFERAVSRFESPNQQSSPKGLKGKFLLEDLTTLEEAADLAPVAIDKDDVALKATYKARAEEMKDKIESAKAKYELSGLSA